jgi:thiosulfate/3-mercaptopyruvate sulfurtransferase
MCQKFSMMNNLLFSRMLINKRIWKVSMAETTKKLVSGSWLLDHLYDLDVTVLEVSSDQEGKAYENGHIPGAIFCFWKDLLWHETDREFATSSELSDRLGDLGISTDSTIVLCGDPVQYGTYALWVMIMAGVKDVRILDGSRLRWIKDNHPLTSEVPTLKPIKNKTPKPNSESRIGRVEVLDKLNSSNNIFLDARSPEEYRGERVSPPGGFDHGAERRGRIPGAVHLFFRDLLSEDDTFISEEDLKKKFAKVGITGDGEKEIVSYCRLSHRATLAWFAINEILGIDKVKIYDGSWTEWGSIVGFPVEQG